MQRPMIWPPYIEGGISHAMAKAKTRTYDRARQCHHASDDIYIVLCDSPWFLCKTCLDEKMLKAGELKPEKCIRCMSNIAHRMTYITAVNANENKFFFYFGVCDDCFIDFSTEIETVRKNLGWT